jgi:hypothetical protein
MIPGLLFFLSSMVTLSHNPAIVMMVGAAWQQRTDYGDDDVEEKYELGTLQVKVLRRNVNRAVDDSIKQLKDTIV